MDRGGDPLRNHGDRLAVTGHVVADGVRLDADEPRRHDLPSGVNARGCLRRAKTSARSDGGDAITAQRDIPVEPRRASSIDHASVLDDDVERAVRWTRRYSGAWSARRQECEQ